MKTMVGVLISGTLLLVCLIPYVFVPNIYFNFSPNPVLHIISTALLLTIGLSLVVGSGRQLYKTRNDT